jgi:hypothetical protein
MPTDPGVPVPGAAAPQTQALSFHLDAPIERVMPMFTAAGERDWAPGWEPEMLAGNAERGSAFRTRNERGLETVWVVADYRPREGRASYARIALGSNIGLVDVHCVPSDGSGTDVTVRYTLTGLDAAGRAFVAGFLAPASYAAMIEEWRQATAKCLVRPTSSMSHNVY